MRHPCVCRFSEAFTGQMMFSITRTWASGITCSLPTMSWASSVALAPTLSSAQVPLLKLVRNCVPCLAPGCHASMCLPQDHPPGAYHHRDACWARDGWGVGELGLILHPSLPGINRVTLSSFSGADNVDTPGCHRPMQQCEVVTVTQTCHSWLLCWVAPHLFKLAPGLFLCSWCCCAWVGLLVAIVGDLLAIQCTARQAI